MYTRKFIILRKDLGTTTGRNPKGHGKLEIKGPRGFVSVTIENANEQDIYNVVFIAKDKSSPILNLGKIFTDDLGRGKGDYSFMQKEVLLESIKGILVMKDTEILLGGYLDKEDGTIERYIETIFEIPNIEDESVLETDLGNIKKPLEEFLTESEDEILLKQENAMEKDILEENMSEEIIEEEDIYQEDICEEDNEDEVIVEEINDVEDIIKQDIILDQEVDLDKDEDLEPDYHTIEHIKKLNQKNQTTNYVLSILRFFPYIDPFKYNLKGYNWWMVELDKENEYSSFLPYFSHLSGGNNKEPYESDIVTCTQLMNKYQHYLFGLYNENEQVKYFVYGVPGSFTKSEHPNKGLGGFNTWYQGINVEGYWIIYIDPMTGKPVNPFNVMNPID